MPALSWPMPRSGDQLGRWKLRRQLDQGGNAVVWLAAEVGGEELVALKVLRPPERRESYLRFALEVDVHLRLLRDAPGVVPLLEAEVRPEENIDQPPWFVMPLAERLDLHFPPGSAPAKDVVSAIADIARTLAGLLDQHGISHRDIKPQNLYWYLDRPAVGDFGLVEVPEDLGITREDRDLGPRQFLAPEMRAGQEERTGPPADVYGLALCAFFLITGEVALGGLRIDEPQHSLANRLGEEHYRDLDRVLQRATRADPAARPSMAQFKAELSAWLHPPSQFLGDVDTSRALSRLRAVRMPVPPHRRGVEQDLDLDDRRSELATRLANRGRRAFDVMNSLGLEAARAHRLFERADPLELSFDGGSSLAVQPPDADNAVWLAGGIAQRLIDSANFYVVTTWQIGRFDQPPDMNFVRHELVDPRGPAGLYRLDALVDAWTGELAATLDAFAAEAERYAATTNLAASSPDRDPPDLRDLTIENSPDEHEGVARIVAKAHIVDLVAGVAGAGYTSSPSQLRLRGPGGESVDLMFNADIERVCGTRYDGFYESSARIEPFHPEGEWTVEYMLLVDQAGHAVHLGAPNLGSRGLPKSVVVRRPPQWTVSPEERL